VSSLAKKVRARLERDASPEVKANFERYFKGQVQLLGLKRPALAVIERELKPSFAALSLAQRQEEALGLLGSPFLEERQIAVGVLAKDAKKLPDSFLTAVEPIFDRVAKDWATCDLIAGKLLRVFVLRSPKTRRRVVGWSRSKNLWRQRASAVAFVNEARKGQHDDEIMEICERIVKNPERFVQLGCGWVLRELYLAAPDRVSGFLRSHEPELSREGLRYAIEKMPRRLQKSLLDSHRAPSPRVR